MRKASRRAVRLTPLLLCAGLPLMILPASGQDSASPPPSPAPPPAASSPAALRPVRLARFVPTAEKRMVSFVATLFPDCSSRGPIVARVLTAPEHGKIDATQGDSFSNFVQGSPLAACNNRKSPGLMISYESDPGYVGEDAAKLFLIFPDGSAGEWEYTFVVK